MKPRLQVLRCHQVYWQQNSPFACLFIYLLFLFEQHAPFPFKCCCLVFLAWLKGICLFSLTLHHTGKNSSQKNDQTFMRVVQSLMIYRFFYCSSEGVCPLSKACTNKTKHQSLCIFKINVYLGMDLDQQQVALVYPQKTWMFVLHSAVVFSNPDSAWECRGDRNLRFVLKEASDKKTESLKCL